MRSTVAILVWAAVAVVWALVALLVWRAGRRGRHVARRRPAPLALPPAPERPTLVLVAAREPETAPEAHSPGRAAAVRLPVLPRIQHAQPPREA